MEAIVLTDTQATDLEVANVTAGDCRALKPRLLQDGRLILNADILDDPYFADPSKPWAAILGISAPQEIPVDRTADPGAPQTADATADNSVPSPQSLALPIVDLTDAELAEPNQ